MRDLCFWFSLTTRKRSNAWTDASCKRKLNKRSLLKPAPLLDEGPRRVPDDGRIQMSCWFERLARLLATQPFGIGSGRLFLEPYIRPALFLGSQVHQPPKPQIFISGYTTGYHSLRREYSVGRFLQETGRSTVAQQRHNRTARRRRIKSSRPGVATKCRAARKVVQPSCLDVRYTLSLCVIAPVVRSRVMAWWYIPFPLFSLCLSTRPCSSLKVLHRSTIRREPR